MDVALYIRELLALHSEVWVPGLGNFYKCRINGYFNEKENRFYPPAYILSFDVKGNESLHLATYISQKKNISTASARYFVEKFVRVVHEQARKGIADEIALLGNLYYDENKLIFDPIQRDEINAIFYGLKPTKISPLSSFIAPGPLPATVQHYQDSAPLIAQPTYADIDGDELEKPKGLSLWVKLLFILIISGLSLLIIYQYNPLVIDQLRSQRFIKQLIDSDSLKINKTETTIQVDSNHLEPLNQPAVVETPIAPVADTLIANPDPKPFEILGGAFARLSEAEKAIQVYESKGLSAHILNNAHGRLFKVTLGSFENEDDAIKKRDSIVKFTNIQLKDIYIQRYKKKD
jgi:hypothetical protein